MTAVVVAALASVALLVVVFLVLGAAMPSRVWPLRAAGAVFLLLVSGMVAAAAWAVWAWAIAEVSA